MQALQSPALLSSDSHAMDQLHDFLRRRRETCAPVEDFERFEQDLHRLFVAAEREALGHELARFDLDVPRVEIEGERYDRVLRCETTYTSAAGPVRVERSLYRSPSGGRAICPLELRAGMIEGYWTPLAAKQATWAVSHLTPKESEELFDLIGNMTPSKSTLDRLPKALSVYWEAQRPQFEATLRKQETIPPEAVSMAVSLDGVMAPMKDGKRQAKRQDAVAKGKSPSGPAGYQEVGCATVSYYDRFGERLVTRRMARMPETKKATLKSQLTAEVMGALIQRPDLRGIQSQGSEVALSELEPGRIGELPVEVAAYGVDEHGIRGTHLYAAGFFERQDALHPSRAFVTVASLRSFTPHDGKSPGALRPVIRGFNPMFQEKDPQ